MTKLLAATEPETTEQCLKDLNGILVRYNNGIPSGVKKIEMVRSIRSMKYVQVGKKQKPLPTWSKGSEIAYQVCDLSPLFFVNFSVIFLSMSS
jgi:tRNA(Ser,Leu) C12 N-acetylase TAN1